MTFRRCSLAARALPKLVLSSKGATPVFTATIDLRVEPTDSDAGTRRFRWYLSVPGEPEMMSPGTLATRREAVQAGEAACQRAAARLARQPAATIAALAQ